MVIPDFTTRPSHSKVQQGGRLWLMLAVLLLGQFMGLLDVTIVNVAVPTIGADLHASGASLQLVVGGYTVAYAMLLITGARLGDLYGRRRMYLLGAVVFTCTSLVCGIAPNSATLIIARFAQGAGAAVMVPQIMSVIQMRFEGPARAKALSAYGLVLSIGSLAGLILGGVLVSTNLLDASWRSVFLVNVPLGIILVTLIPRLVPADEPRGTRRLDFAGLVIAVPAVVLVVLPLVLGHEAGWPAWTFVCIATGIVLAGVFVLVERSIAARGGDPLLNLAVLRAPGLISGLGTLTCMQVTYGGFMFTLALHLQQGLADSALRAGLTFVPVAAVFGLVGFSWRALPERIHHLLSPAGMAISVLGYIGIALGFHDGTQDSPLLWTALVVGGVGMGMTLSPLLTQALVHVPSTKAADASGVLTTTMQLGQLIGVAAFGTVYLSLATPLPALPLARALSSAHAMSTSAEWMALLSLAGVLCGIVLARTVRRAERLDATG
ncbi:MFS transporter [Microbispora corallina]|uniref:MFS transporter n=1 Tax=Microbispora corallina TaxID=83302 RepID=A0ABQ4G8X6_9ACTN|nr:MFS transporter [Microbispora corallina]GIH43479.1 MFS transporter [Microbispora corallina]